MARRLLIVSAVLVAAYILLAVGFAGAIAYFQPENDRTVVLITRDHSGTGHETVLQLRQDDKGQLLLVSGQWFRGWYGRALENPNVELRRGNRLFAYRATPGDEADIAKAQQEYLQGMSRVESFARQAQFLFAPAKVLKLEPLD